MRATLEWFGTATWRLEVDNTVIWLDAYVDRAPTAAPLRLDAAAIDRADWVLIGHSHFDHVAEAGLIARNTGATVIGSALTCEIVRDEGVPADRVTPCVGGETLQLGPVRLRVFASLHGFNGLREWPDPRGRDTRARRDDLRRESPELCEAALAHLANIPEKQRQDGGPLAYLLEWDGFRLFWHDTPGMVTASWEAVAAYRPDLALLSIAPSTPNLDGVPFESGHAGFVAHMAAILKPRRVVLNHHDDWCPPLTWHMEEEGFRQGVQASGAVLQVRRLNEVFELTR
ncbi:MAG: MBL fold metallo-hydrolase [Chloroflexi bacterium]|nr:MBL fold metallo-hydrolase [Chloroflexota bacterium]